MFRMRVLAVTAIAVAASMTGFADLTPKYSAWPKGPVQWLMTRDEQRAWRAIKTDDQAQAFIDLFWARRDPTPGTELNEFRQQFEARVRYCDENYKSDRKAGSLTEMGRVFIVLGPPANAGMSSKDLGGLGSGPGMPSGPPLAGGGARGANGIADPGSSMAHQLAAKTTFEYARPFELGLSGPVVFIQSFTTHEFMIDTQQSNVAGALASGVQKAIVNPTLTEVPEWGRTKPTFPRSAEVRTEEEVTPASPPVVTRKLVTPAAPTVVAGAAGAHDLMLLANVRVIKVGEDSDPFARVEKKWAFHKADDLGFAFQYCATTVSSPRPRLTMSITMSGKTNGTPVSVSTPEDEVLAEPITTLPGCYLIRGAVPLESMDLGSYGFFVNVKDPDSGKDFTLEKGFTIE